MKRISIVAILCFLCITGFSQAEGPSDQKNKMFFSDCRNAYNSIALGTGPSYGGMGVRFQGRTGKILGFGYHAGIGYSIGEWLAYGGVGISAGVKLFWHKSWYLNCQFGPVMDYIILDENRMVIESGNAWGPSILVGGDWFINQTFGINAAIGQSFNITEPDAEEQELPRIEFGFIIKF